VGSDWGGSVSTREIQKGEDGEGPGRREVRGVQAGFKEKVHIL